MATRINLPIRTRQKHIRPTQLSRLASASMQGHLPQLPALHLLRWPGSRLEWRVEWPWRDRVDANAFRRELLRECARESGDSALSRRIVDQGRGTSEALPGEIRLVVNNFREIFIYSDEHTVTEVVLMIAPPRLMCGTANLAIAIILTMLRRKMLSTWSRGRSAMSGTMT